MFKHTHRIFFDKSGFLLHILFCSLLSTPLQNQYIYVLNSVPNGITLYEYTKIYYHLDYLGYSQFRANISNAIPLHILLCICVFVFCRMYF